MQYPIGYGTTLTSLAGLDARHGHRMHPEFRVRLFRWLESMGGLVGIGGGWRATGTQPDLPGFAPEGKSFHQDQAFASGFVGYCAVDLVARNGARSHRSPSWAESATAPAYGLHTFIADEPWHMQPIEIRGHSSWVNAGRPDPAPFYPAQEAHTVKILRPARRVFDSRDAGAPLTGGVEHTIDILARGAVGVVANITAINPTAAGHVTVWDAGERPAVSHINYAAGQVIANAVVVPTAADGTVKLYTRATAHIIIDVQAYLES